MQGIPPNRSLRRNAKQENVKNKLHEWRVSKWNFYWLERPCSRLCTTLFSPLFTTLCTTLYIKLPYTQPHTNENFSVLNSQWWTAYHRVSQRFSTRATVRHCPTSCRLVYFGYFRFSAIWRNRIFFFPFERQNSQPSNPPRALSRQSLLRHTAYASQSAVWLSWPTCSWHNLQTPRCLWLHGVCYKLQLTL